MSRLFTRLQQRIKPKHLTLFAAGTGINSVTNTKDNSEQSSENTQQQIVSESNLNTSSMPSMKSVAGPITFGVCMGACAGVASKKVTKAAAVLVGVTFIGLQGLQYAGYITIDWLKVEDDVIKAVDQNDDGKFDEKDIAILKRKYMAVLQQSVFAGSGFIAGFAAGFKWG
eukprot:94619_1